MNNLNRVFNVKDVNPNPSKELIEALDEGEQILKDIKNGKRKPYNNPDELFADLDNE